MESQHMLSPQAYSFLTSQEMLLPQNFNKSEYLKRIQNDVEKMFSTFEIILSSQRLEPQYLSKLFPAERIQRFLSSLTYYDGKTLPKEENVRLEIARQMLRLGFVYYQRRFKETKFFSKKIGEINELIEDLNQITNYQIEEEDAIRMYQVRKGLKAPPEIRPDQFYKSLCMYCFNYGLGNNNTEEEAIKNIRHERDCSYNKYRKNATTKEQIALVNQQFIHIIKPILK